jgi:hypothetical protein
MNWIDMPFIPIGGEESGFGRFVWEKKKKIP